MIKPILEPEFKPAIIELRSFFDDANKYPSKQHLIVSIERAEGYIYRKEIPEYKKSILVCQVIL